MFVTCKRKLSLSCIFPTLQVEEAQKFESNMFDFLKLFKCWNTCLIFSLMCVFCGLLFSKSIIWWNFFVVFSVKIFRIKNARFSGYCFYMNTNICGDLQICISVPLIENLIISFFLPIIFGWLIIMQN